MKVFPLALEIDIMKNMLATIVLSIFAGLCVALLCARLPMDEGWFRIARPFVAVGIVMVAGLVLHLLRTRVLLNLPGGFGDYQFPNLVTVWGALLAAQTAFVVWMLVLGNCSWLPKVFLDGRPYLMNEGGWITALLSNLCFFVIVGGFSLARRRSPVSA